MIIIPGHFSGVIFFKVKSNKEVVSNQKLMIITLQLKKIKTDCKRQAFHQIIFLSRSSLRVTYIYNVHLYSHSLTCYRKKSAVQALENAALKSLPLPLRNTYRYCNSLSISTLEIANWIIYLKQGHKEGVITLHALTSCKRTSLHVLVLVFRQKLR